jgi:transcriptional regulator with XRE-family HTH domain
MGTVERVAARGDRRGRRILTAFAEEFRDARVELGLSQADVAAAARISRTRYCRVESAGIESLSILEAARVAAVVGLDLGARLYPGGRPLRDEASASRLGAIAAHVASPLRMRLEVPLPPQPDRIDQRAWDAEIQGVGERTTMELEMRLRDAQAVERRIAIKLRDDPPDHFVLVVAATDHNRGVLRDHPALFPDLPRLKPSAILRPIEAGRHPPTGLVLL